jgi:hypothetical protein
MYKRISLWHGNWVEFDMSQLHRIDWCNEITTDFYSKGTRFETWHATLRWLPITEDFHCLFTLCTVFGRPQKPCRSTAACLLGLWVPIPSEAWLFVCFDSCALSGRGLWVGLITHLEESYQVWCDWVWSWSLDNEGALATGRWEEAVAAWVEKYYRFWVPHINNSYWQFVHQSPAVTWQYTSVWPWHFKWHHYESRDSLFQFFPTKGRHCHMTHPLNPPFTVSISVDVNT